MTTQASNLTPAALLIRAKAAVACGDNQGAIAAALVVIAEASVPREPVPVAYIESREMAAAAMTARQWATERATDGTGVGVVVARALDKLADHFEEMGQA